MGLVLEAVRVLLTTALGFIRGGFARILGAGSRRPN